MSESDDQKTLSIEAMGAFNESSGAPCTRYQQAMELIGKRWTGAILFVLMKRAHRFNELLSAIPGLSDRLLTERLRELEAHGVVARHVLTQSPVGVEYQLTEAGEDLQAAVLAIADWAHRWLEEGRS